eukprot:4138096-Prorocentrum_lima.AAC.1
MLEALSEQRNNAIVPTHTPPGELVQSASSVGNAGVDGKDELLCIEHPRHVADSLVMEEQARGRQAQRE